MISTFYKGLNDPLPTHTHIRDLLVRQIALKVTSLISFTVQRPWTRRGNITCWRHLRAKGLRKRDKKKWIWNASSSSLSSKGFPQIRTWIDSQTTDTLLPLWFARPTAALKQSALIWKCHPKPPTRLYLADGCKNNIRNVVLGREKSGPWIIDDLPCLSLQC